jgi:small-conductance mechanosensitive channel
MNDTNLSETLNDLLPALLAVLPSALLVLAGAALLRIATNRGLKVMTHRTRLTASEIKPVKKTLNWLIWGATTILLLGIFGFNLGGLWTVVSTTLAMVAIGFVAVWSVLSNISCTLMILLFRPFSIGDRLEFPGEDIRGEAIDLNFLYTTLETTDGYRMQVPNNLFF